MQLFTLYLDFGYLACGCMRFKNQTKSGQNAALCTAHCALFSHLFCFSSQRAVIWCAGVNRDFVIILIHYFLTNRVCTVHTEAPQCTLHTVFLPFCFSSQRAQIQSAGLNLDFVNILIHYCLTNRGSTVHTHTVQCTLSTVFPTFLFFKLESSNLICLIKFQFGKHFYTFFYEILAPLMFQRAHQLIVSKLIVAQIDKWCHHLVFFCFLSQIHEIFRISFFSPDDHCILGPYS